MPVNRETLEPSSPQTSSNARDIRLHHMFTGMGFPITFSASEWDSSKSPMDLQNLGDCNITRLQQLKTRYSNTLTTVGHCWSSHRFNRHENAESGNPLRIQVQYFGQGAEIHLWKPQLPSESDNRHPADCMLRVDAHVARCVKVWTSCSRRRSCLDQ